MSAALVHRDLRENAARREARFLATAPSKLRVVALSMLRHFKVFPDHVSQDMRTRKLMFEANDYGAILRSDDELSLPIAVGTRLSWHLLTRGDIYIVVHDECDEGPVGEIDARQLPVAIPWIEPAWCQTSRQCIVLSSSTSAANSPPLSIHMTCAVNTV